tara:strand:- start:166 stop:1305 length:1140 start_codon:yes stop_codon:yes gene_type:complete
MFEKFLKLFKDKYYILKSSSRRSSDKILSEMKVSISDIDMEKISTLDEFVNFKNKAENYNETDFLIRLNAKEYKKFKKNKAMSLSDVDAIGWYNDKEHLVKKRFFIDSHQNTYKRIQNIEFKSFDRLRCTYRPEKIHNMFWGAFGISYYYYSEDFNKFLSKFETCDNKWIIDLTSLDVANKQMLIQMLVAADKKLINQEIMLSIMGETKSLDLLKKLISTTRDYYIDYEYDIENFTKKIGSKFKECKHELSEKISDEIEDLYKNQLIGKDSKPSTAIAKIVKSFIYLVTTEPEDLAFIDKKKVSKTAIFFIGMHNTGNHISNILNLPNQIISFIEILTDIKKIDLNEDKLYLTFNKKQSESVYNDVYSLIKEPLAISKK